MSFDTVWGKAPDVAYFDGYKATKEANPDSIVLYQVGSFYEMYGEDARTVASLLNLVLTTRPGIAGPVELCSFPVRNLDERLLERLRENHAVTITAFDEDQTKHLAYTLQALNAPAKDSSEVSATSPETSEKEKRPGRSRVELNYRTFAKMFPEVASGEYRYLRMEAGEVGGGMMPLHLEWIGRDEIAISHTFVQNGDLMRDPEMTFRVDREKGALEPLTYRQDGTPQMYQKVYPRPGRWIPKLRNDLSRFAGQWFSNIDQQRYHKREAVIVRDGEDVRLAFDQDGKVLEPAPNTPAVEWTVSPVKLYRNALELVDREINRGGWVYEQLRDHAVDYDSARNALDGELNGYLEVVAGSDSETIAACQTLPEFREWLVEDILARNYQDAVTTPKILPLIHGTLWIGTAAARMPRNGRVERPLHHG